MLEESIRRLDAGIIGMNPDVSLAEIAKQVNQEFCRIRTEDRDVWKAIIKSKDEGFADALLSLFDLLGDETMKDDGYNGWSNWETWTCSLWIANEESLYNIGKNCENYQDFIDVVETAANGDGVNWKDPAVDIAEMDAFIAELN